MLDSRLKFIKQVADSQAGLELLVSTGRFGIRITDDEPHVRVLVQAKENVTDKALLEVGLRVSARVEDVATGEIAISQLDKLDVIDGVILVEGVRPLDPELDLSLPETRANLVHAGPPGRRGAGVIVGIIDSGVDWRHQSFRNATGGTRILRIWDQLLAPVAGETSPAPFGYGVEYDSTQINTALTAANPLAVVRHMDNAVGHGTHVTGIAAGDGSVAGNGSPAFTFIGVAPEADIIVVANRVTTDALGDSASTLDAVQYIFNVAQALGRPCVINLSQGDNLGPHDGTSLLERGIDNLLGGQGRSMVKSAGNAANGSIHASGAVPAGGSITLPAQFPAGSMLNTIDIWYAGMDRFSVRITPPGGVASIVVTAGSTTTLNFPNGNQVFVDSVIGHPNNGDNRIFLQFSRGTALAIGSGVWNIDLIGATVIAGGWHAWIERGNLIPQFTGPFRNDDVTISIPGTAREVITAGSYITRGAGVGNLSTFSSRGPTRDGRTAPTLSAPGQSIMSVLVGAGTGVNQYQAMNGTSMAAPHITGVIALMLQARPNLTQPQIIDCLTRTARSDVFTGATPNFDWGAGKMDAQGAVNCAAPVVITRLTRLTRFTRFTLFTPFTRFTFFTRFTRFTFFTPITRFTPLTRFTRFTPFTRFFDPGRPPLRESSPEPFIRFHSILFDPAELAIEQLPELAAYAEVLFNCGVRYLHELVTMDWQSLSEMAGLSEEEAAQIVATAQQLLRGMM